MSDTDIAPPRHDFYQTPEHVIAAVYIKGLNAEGVQDKVDIQLEENKVVIRKPAVSSSDTVERITFSPLFAPIKPAESSYRIQSTKIELKLIKTSPLPWLSLVGPTVSADTTASPAASGSSMPSGSTSAAQGQPLKAFSASNTHRTAEGSGAVGSALEGKIGVVPAEIPLAGGPSKIEAVKKAAGRKNWDKLVEDELDEKAEDGSKDPNAGGDQALQKMFAGIYANADPDARRAMIKSFTESGGTTLSTDWSSIGKEKTPTRPPDGMEAKKY